MKPKKLLPLFFCLGLLIVTALFAPDVQAQSYYNWVRASGMETSTNWVEDGGFESGGFGNGVLYGNWSIVSATPTIDGASARTGSYGLDTDAGDVVWYNFTSPYQPIGSDIVEFSFWTQSAGSNNATLLLYYNDGSDSGTLHYATSASWEKQNATSDIALTKYLNCIRVTTIATDCNFDDFFVGVQDSETQDGQFTTTSYPWRIDGDPAVDFIGHNLIWGRDSNGSGYIGYTEATANFIQDIDYLDSNTVHYIDVWAHNQHTASVAVEISLVYSDRSSSTKQVNTTVLSTWENLNFGGAWIDPNKHIVQIQISLANYIPQYVNLDDFGIWSSLQANQQRFTFTVMPAPTEQTAIAFTSYQQVQHTFYGFLWNETELNEDGSFAVVTEYGSTSGAIVDGQFNFTLAQRQGSATFSEQIAITMVIDGESVFVAEITATWTYVGGGDDPVTDPTYVTPELMTFFGLFLIIFVPPMGVAFEFSARGVNPIIGFVGSLLLVTAIGVLSRLVPEWFLFVSVLATIFFMFGMVKGGVIKSTN